MDNGGQPTRRRRRWQRLANQLQRLKTDYNNEVRDVQRYWNAVSHLVTTF
jgi:DNA-binding ferritin-like protein (Dps family)